MSLKPTHKFMNIFESLKIYLTKISIYIPAQYITIVDEFVKYLKDCANSLIVKM